jgi:hypothetical protein
MLTTKSYLTRSLINKLFKKKLSNDELDNLVLKGSLIRKYSYYQPSESLLRDLDIIPHSAKITGFGDLAKGNAFTLKRIQEMFGDCHQDAAKLIASKFFFKKWNYFYKKDNLVELLNEGVDEVTI